MTELLAPSASWPTLRLRAELLGQLREFFRVHEFLEVETPLVAREVVLDAHIEPLAVADPTGDSVGERVGGVMTAAGQRWYLQSSPEAHMKRLLAAGAPAIYQITRSFRRGEQGALHNPEFTIVEWYRPGDSMAAGMELLAELIEQMLKGPRTKQTSYAEAFRRDAGIDPHAATDEQLRTAADGLADPSSLAELARDELLNLLLVEKVEPHLGLAQPEIIYDFPASQAALAQVRDGEPPVAERFELYVRGVELANGYHELQDPDELRRRMEAENDRRASEGLDRLPLPDQLIAAMEAGLPDCTGVALGFDRLVMLAAGETSISRVMAFPLERV